MRRVLPVLVLIGCGSGGDSEATGTVTGTGGGIPSGTTSGQPCTWTTTFSILVAWNDDGASPEDTDGDGTIDAGCGDTVDVYIGDCLAADWWIGMVHQEGEGWTGEDCFQGTASMSLCHPIGLSDRLAQVCTVDELVAGETTLFHAGLDSSTTYYLEDDSGECFVLGDDPSYYQALGCTEMM